MRRMGVRSANEMGRRSGLPGQTITSILRSSREDAAFTPRRATIEKIAAAGNVSVIWLEHGADTPPRELTVDRTVADPPAPSSRTNALQRAFWDAAKALSAGPEDYDAVRVVWTEAATYLDADGDVAGFAESVLRAAMSLRRDGLPVNTASILTRVAAGRTFGAEARYEAPNEAVQKMVDDAARAAGEEPGSREAQAKAMAAKVEARRKRGG